MNKLKIRTTTLFFTEKPDGVCYADDGISKDRTNTPASQGIGVQFLLTGEGAYTAISVDLQTLTEAVTLLKAEIDRLVEQKVFTEEATIKLEDESSQVEKCSCYDEGIELNSISNHHADDVEEKDGSILKLKAPRSLLTVHKYMIDDLNFFNVEKESEASIHEQLNKAINELIESDPKNSGIDVIDD
jgi:hypothetical protein